MLAELYFAISFLFVLFGAFLAEVSAADELEVRGMAILVQSPVQLVKHLLVTLMITVALKYTKLMNME